MATETHPAEETVTVPVATFNQLKESADRLSALAERERVLRGLMAKRRAAWTTRPPSKRKAVRNAQREARRMNRRKK